MLLHEGQHLVFHVARAAHQIQMDVWNLRLQREYSLGQPDHVFVAVEVADKHNVMVFFVLFHFRAQVLQPVIVDAVGDDDIFGFHHISHSAQGPVTV